MNESNAFDATWHELALKGDAKAVLEFVERTLRPLYLCCAEHADGDRVTSEEIAQRVMLRAVRSLQSYSPAQYENDIFRWLSGIALDEVFEVLSGRQDQTTDDASWPTDQEFYKQLLAADAACDPLNENGQSETYGPDSHFVDQVEADMCVAAKQMRGKTPSDNSSSRLKAKQVSAVNVACPFCGHWGQLNESLLGRDVRCSECGHVYATGSTVVPSEQTVSTPVDAIRQWYYRESGRAIGPFAAYELRDKISSGELSHHVPVRKGPDGDWKEAVGSSELYGPESHCPDDHHQGTNAAQSEQAGSRAATPHSVLAPVKPPPVPPPSALAPFKPLKRTRRKLPKKIGRFDILDWLERGSFGDVYRAHDPVLDRDVALKVLRSSVAVNPDARAFFLQEPKAAAKLRHPHIVTVYDAGTEGELLYIAIDFIDGETLQDVLEQNQVDFEKVAKTIRSLAEALHYAHQVGVVHRDVKPGNVMIDRDGQALLMDFGLARIEHSSDGPDSKEHQLLGTPGYLAPEQADGSYRKVGPHSDQYGLGVVMYEMLCGKKPFSGPPDVLIFNTINVAPEPPHSKREEVPEDLDAICLKAIAKSSEERYAHCGEMAEDLRRFLDNEETQVRPWPLPERIDRWRQREPWLAGMTGIAISLVLAFVLLAVIYGIQKGKALKTVENALQGEKAERERAEKAQVDAERAEKDADKARIDAENAEKATERARRETSQNQTVALLHLAQHRSESGEIPQGLAHLVESLKYAEKDAPDYVPVIQDNLAAWWNHIHPLRALVPPDGRRYFAPYLAAVSHDGRLAATARSLPDHRQSSLSLWNLNTNVPTRCCLPVNTNLVLAICFKSKSNVFATLERRKDGPGTQVQFWNFNGKTLQPHSPLPPDAKDSLQCAAFSPDDKWLLVGGERDGVGVVREFDVTTGTVRRSLPPLAYPVRSVAYAPDGGAFAVGTGSGQTGTVGVFDARTGEPRFPQRNSELVHDVAFSSDGQYVAIATGGLLKGKVQQRNAHSGSAVGSEMPQLGEVYSVAYLDNFILSGSQDRSVVAWDRNTGRMLGHRMWHHRDVRAVCPIADRVGKRSRFLTASDDGTLRVWSLGAGTVAESDRVSMGIADCTYDSVSGQLLLAAAISNEIIVIKSGALPAEEQIRFPLEAAPTAVAAINKEEYLLGFDNGAVARFDLRNKKTDTTKLEQFNATVRCAVVAPRQALAVTGTKDGWLAFWDLRPELSLRKSQRPGGTIYAVACDPLDDVVVSGGNDSQIRFWNYDGKSLGHVDLPDAVLSLAFSNDGSYLAIGYAGGGQVRRRDPANPVVWTKVSEFELENGITSVHVLNNRELLVTGDRSGVVRFFHLKTGEPIGPAMHQDSMVRFLAANSDESAILSCTVGGSIRRWSLPTRRDLRHAWAKKRLASEVGFACSDTGIVHRLAADKWLPLPAEQSTPYAQDGPIAGPRPVPKDGEPRYVFSFIADLIRTYRTEEPNFHALPPEELDRFLPTDTRGVIAVDVKQLLAAPMVRRLVFANLAAILDSRTVKPWLRVGRFRLLRDIDYSVLTIPQARGEAGLLWIGESLISMTLVVHGRFDSDNILKVIEESEDVDDFKVLQPGETPIIQFAAKDFGVGVFTHLHVAIHDRALIMSPSLAAVRSALEPPDDHHLDGSFLKLLGEVDKRQSLWFAVTSDALPREDVLKDTIPEATDREATEIEDLPHLPKTLSGGITVFADLKANLTASFRTDTSTRRFQNLLAPFKARLEELPAKLGEGTIKLDSDRITLTLRLSAELVASYIDRLLR